jgi:serine/threonine-protein kinase
MGCSAVEQVLSTNGTRVPKLRGSQPIAEAVNLVLQLLDALAYAHGLGIVYRDIKPANLLLAPAGEGWHLKVADFGLARSYQASSLSGLTLSGAGGGTPLFMPPEQVTDFRSVRPAADQYAAAATLYHLLTGRHPYEADTLTDLLRKILLEDPVPVRLRRSEVSPALAAVLHQTLARRPEDRFAGVRAIAQALLGVSG